MFGTLADAGVNIEMISTSEVRITCIDRRGRARDRAARPARRVRARAARDRSTSPRSARADAATRRLMTDFLARQERFASVGSTNDVVRGWLADGTPEVCVAVADEQTAGRGRDGRRGRRRPGAALLLSLGFRPAWLAAGPRLAPGRTRRLAMADAAEEVAGLADGAIRLKWPNDLVVESAGADGGVRKLRGRARRDRRPRARDDPRVVVGLGVNADWAARRLPAGAGRLDDLAARGVRRSADRSRRAARRVPRRGSRRAIEALRDGRFDGAGWTDRQLTTGRDVRLDRARRARRDASRAVGVDARAGGARRRRRSGGPGGERHGPRRRDPPRPAGRSGRADGRGVTRWPDRH